MSETRPTDAGTERPPKTPRRRRWYWAGGLVVVGALVWFAPAIVAGTGLRQQRLETTFPPVATGDGLRGTNDARWAGGSCHRVGGRLTATPRS